MSQYSPRSCDPQTQQSGTHVDVLPSIGGACYTLYMLGTIPNLDANRVRFVFHLETKSGTGDLKIPDSWKLIDSDKRPLFFGCSTSPQTECKLDSGKFWCETDLMCVLDCISCSYRPVAVPSYNGNECTSSQITTLEIPSTQGLLSPGAPGKKQNYNYFDAWSGTCSTHTPYTHTERQTERETVRQTDRQK